MELDSTLQAAIIGGLLAIIPTIIVLIVSQRSENRRNSLQIESEIRKVKLQQLYPKQMEKAEEIIGTLYSIIDYINLFTKGVQNLEKVLEKGRTNEEYKKSEIYISDIVSAIRYLIPDWDLSHDIEFRKVKDYDRKTIDTYINLDDEIRRYEIRIDQFKSKVLCNEIYFPKDQYKKIKDDIYKFFELINNIKFLKQYENENRELEKEYVKLMNRIIQRLRRIIME